jgi:hypothetical protein
LEIQYTNDHRYGSKYEDHVEHTTLAAESSSQSPDNRRPPSYHEISRSPSIETSHPRYTRLELSDLEEKNDRPESPVPPEDRTEIDASSDSEENGDDTATLNSVEAIDLGIPELSFHRAKVVKRVTIYSRSPNFTYSRSCDVLLDTGASVNVISKSLKQQLAQFGFPKRRYRKGITLGDGSVRKVRTLMEIDWDFGKDSTEPTNHEGSRYTHGFFSLQNSPYDMIIGHHVIFEYKLLRENLEILPLGLPASDAEQTGLLVLGLKGRGKGRHAAVTQ